MTEVSLGQHSLADPIQMIPTANSMGQMGECAGCVWVLTLVVWTNTWCLYTFSLKQDWHELLVAKPLVVPIIEILLNQILNWMSISAEAYRK